MIWRTDGLQGGVGVEMARRVEGEGTTGHSSSNRLNWDARRTRRAEADAGALSRERKGTRPAHAGGRETREK